MIRPEDAKKKMELSKQMVAQKTVQHNLLSVKKNIIEEIEINIKDVTISVTYVSNNCYFHNYLLLIMNKVYYRN